MLTQYFLCEYQVPPGKRCVLPISLLYICFHQQTRSTGPLKVNTVYVTVPSSTLHMTTMMKAKHLWGRAVSPLRHNNRLMPVSCSQRNRNERPSTYCSFESPWLPRVADSHYLIECWSHTQDLLRSKVIVVLIAIRWVNKRCSNDREGANVSDVWGETPESNIVPPLFPVIPSVSRTRWLTHAYLRNVCCGYLHSMHLLPDLRRTRLKQLLQLVPVAGPHLRSRGTMIQLLYSLSPRLGTHALW